MHIYLSVGAVLRSQGKMQATRSSVSTLRNSSAIFVTFPRPPLHLLSPSSSPLSLSSLPSTNNQMLYFFQCEGATKKCMKMAGTSDPRDVSRFLWRFFPLIIP